MKRVIFIVHSSEIVRCGLTLILRKYFNIEIAQLSSPDELNSFTHIVNSTIVIFVEARAQFRYNLINKFKKNNVIQLIGIEGADEDGLDFPPENKINILASGIEIQQILSDILNMPNNQSAELIASSELTTREKDVLKLVALGHSNKEIADQLFISIHTVISHRKNITEKLGIKSISGLTVYAILNKLIDTDAINPEDLI